MRSSVPCGESRGGRWLDGQKVEKIELVGEKRKARALGAAEACRRLLKERFGARRVILFGSLAGQGPWHGRSDIDLAVEGLAPDEFFAAYSACRDLLPPGLELDLLSLESVYPEMRARSPGGGGDA